MATLGGCTGFLDFFSWECFPKESFRSRECEAARFSSAIYYWSLGVEGVSKDTWRYPDAPWARSVTLKAIKALFSVDQMSFVAPVEHMHRIGVFYSPDFWFLEGMADGKISPTIASYMIEKRPDVATRGVRACISLAKQGFDFSVATVKKAEEHALSRNSTALNALFISAKTSYVQPMQTRFASEDTFSQCERLRTEIYLV